MARPESVASVWKRGQIERRADCYIRTPCTLPGFVDFGMAAIVDDEEGVLGFMLLDEAADAHHDIEVGVV